MIIVCNYNDPYNVPNYIPSDFDYGLELGKKYIVMGIMTLKESSQIYFLIDENGSPSWYPHQLFDILDNSLPFDWFLLVNNDQIDDYYYSLIGFKELCNDKKFFEKLILREKEAMATYFNRKNQLSY